MVSGSLFTIWFNPKGPVINLEQISNAATDAAIILLRECRKPRVIETMILVLLYIFSGCGDRIW